MHRAAPNPIHTRRFTKLWTALQLTSKCERKHLRTEDQSHENILAFTWLYLNGERVSADEFKLGASRLVVAGLQLLLRWWGLVGSNTTLHLHERFASGIIHEATPTKLKQTKSSESSRVENFKRNKADGVEIQNATTASSRNLIGPFAHPNWVTAKLHYRFLLLRSKRLSITINSAHYPK